MEDDLHFFENGRQPQFFENDRQPFFCQQKIQKNYKKIMQPETLQIKTIVVAPLRVT